MNHSSSESSDAEAPLDDSELTRKDRSYSPASERETRARQTEANPEADGVKQRPGTGGPDDSGDVEIPGDEIDASTIVARSDPTDTANEH